MDLKALDQQHVWHPFTQMRDWEEQDTLVIDRGEGNWLIDTDGNRYLDGVSSLWVNLHGHGHPHLVEAIQQQAARLAHSTLLGLANGPSAELAAKLADITGLPRVFYSDAGSTAVEIALKLAFQYWQQSGRPGKTRFLHLENSYHGDTLGAVGVGGIPLFHEVYGPLIQPGLAVRNPSPSAYPDEDPASVLASALADLEAQLERNHEQIAAFIVEPLVQGAAGILVHSPEYLTSAAALCAAHDVLLIADEVATGFGRTGAMFACELAGVRPDLMCLAKGITGGTLPLAATLATEQIYSAFLGDSSERKTFFHGHTYTGNPIACAAAIASLEVFEADNVISTLSGKEEALGDALQRQLGNHEYVAEIRQQGLMVGVLLRGDPQMGARICHRARQFGVILRPLGNVVVLMPPLSISYDEIALLTTALVKALDE